MLPGMPPLLKVNVAIDNFISLVGCELDVGDREDIVELVVPRVMLESCMAPEALTDLMSPAKHEHGRALKMKVQVVSASMLTFRCYKIANGTGILSSK